MLRFTSCVNVREGFSNSSVADLIIINSSYPRNPDVDINKEVVDRKCLCKKLAVDLCNFIVVRRISKQAKAFLRSQQCRNVVFSVAKTLAVMIL